MVPDTKTTNILLSLAAEGIAPVLAGCADALTANPVGARTRANIAEPAATAIDLFGRGIVERWQSWVAATDTEKRALAVAELAELSPKTVREQARQALAEFAQDADPRDFAIALEYLCSLPNSLSRAMVVDLAGQRSVPATVTWDDGQTLLQLLPRDIPPYPPLSDLAGTPYRLEELLGTGGFGAVYRASAPTLQHLPLAIKFCLDRSLLPALNLERSNLERLMRAAGERGSGHVVKLYGYDLDHPTPYLVYEYVPGGDLTGYLASHRAESNGAMNAEKVLDVVKQLAEGLAFAHRAGLVHRDVKPANVLVHDRVLKLADFGLGGIAVRRAVERSRIGVTTIDYLTLAERASLFRGAGTPLYMSPEQRRGANPDPRHDLYSLGVLWFQLLAGDVTRELHPGWAKELAVRFKTPAEQIHLIERCVGWLDERPKDASELLTLLKDGPKEPTPLPVARLAPEPPLEPAPRATSETATPVVTTTAFAADSIRKQRLLELLRGLQSALIDARWPAWRTTRLIAGVLFLITFFIAAAGVSAQRSSSYSYSSKSAYSTGEVLAISLGVAAPVCVFVTGILTLVTRVLAEWRANNKRISRLQKLAAEFPAEVEAWGGPDHLQSPAVVAAVIEQVAQPGFRVSLVATAKPASSPASDSAAIASHVRVPEDRMRQTVLRSRLLEYHNARTFATITNIVLGVFTIAVALPLAFALAAVTFEEYSRSRYGTSPPQALGLSVLVWLGIFGLPLITWRLVNNTLRKARQQRADDLAKSYGGVFEQWGGPGFLQDKQALKGVIAELYGSQAIRFPDSATRSEQVAGPGGEEPRS